MTNIIQAVFGASKSVQTRRIWKIDHGMKLRIVGIDLPTAYQVHFSNVSDSGQAIPIVATSDTVDIPDQYLQTGKWVYAWIYLTPEEGVGYTEYMITIPVAQRPDVSSEEPTPVQQSAIDQAIGALNQAVEQTAEDVASASASAESAEASSQAASASAEAAASSAGSASQSATAASSAQAAAESARTAAETARDSASGYADTAAQSASQASQSASQASQSASEAATSAGQAQSIADNIQQTVDDALQEAKDSGEFDGPQGPQGEPGLQGDPGEGVPAGGTTGQMLVKSSDTDYATEWTDPPQGEVTQAEFDALKQYVYDMSPVATVGPVPVVSVSDSAPLEAEGLVVDIEPVQEGTGDPSPDNVRPITGWTSAKVTRCGKNLLPFEDVFEEGWTNTVDGITATYSKGYMKVTGTNTTSGAVNVVPFRNAWRSSRYEFGAGNYAISANLVVTMAVDEGSDVNKAGIVTANTSVSVRGFYIAVSAGKTVDWNIPMMFVSGTTPPTSYEPYVGSTYDITFPSAAGTVYGGKLDVVKGELVVDRAMVTNSNRATRYKNADGYYWYTTARDLNVAEIAGLNAKLISNRLTPVINVTTTTHEGSVSWYANNIIRWKERRELDRTEYLEYLANNPLQFCYELATPITYQLTPQEIAMLRGNNTIFADTGDTTLTYRQDVGLLLEALKQPDESDMVASTTYAANSFFTIGGTLYRATTAIATGETIQPGVNCTATTVADQLTAIYARL